MIVGYVDGIEPIDIISICQSLSNLSKFDKGCFKLNGFKKVLEQPSFSIKTIMMISISLIIYCFIFHLNNDLEHKDEIALFFIVLSILFHFRVHKSFVTCRKVLFITGRRILVRLQVTFFC